MSRGLLEHLKKGGRVWGGKKAGKQKQKYGEKNRKRLPPSQRCPNHLRGRVPAVFLPCRAVIAWLGVGDCIGWVWVRKKDIEQEKTLNSKAKKYTDIVKERNMGMNHR